MEGVEARGLGRGGAQGVTATWPRARAGMSGDLAGARVGRRAGWRDLARRKVRRRCNWMGALQRDRENER
jgi:hypothetical protein